MKTKRKAIVIDNGWTVDVYLCRDGKWRGCTMPDMVWNEKELNFID
jgi:hypothetical protein